jgi:UDP-N-acetylmuramate-alanine ligase
VTGRPLVTLNDFDHTGHFVPVRRLSSAYQVLCQPLDDLVYSSDEGHPVEVASMVPNGSIVVGIGDENKRYYIVKTIDIVQAAYQADCTIRNKHQTK